ncbi:MAG: molybdopterin-dependent oxidoreductase [Planctomycetota bacterium]|nr:molybdopterin-dependent oxidoreductase [Planctomycetota bacterium]
MPTATIQKKTACNRDCPDACGIIATIDDGKVVRLQGDPDHPVTQGFLCHRTSRFLDRQYDPSRITTPLRRRGTDFVPISWEEALDEIAAKLIAVRAESGPAAIMYYRCGGTLGILKAVCDYYFERFGPVTGKSGDVCTGAGDAAQMEDFGDEESHDLFDLYNSKTIVLWGKNLHVSSVHLLPIVKAAQARGAKLVSVDPIRHRTADLCDLFVQPRPGGDSALALGVARVFFETGSQESLLARAEAYSQGPAALHIGWGMQRRKNGSATVRVIDALAAISGNIGIPGGGVSYYFKRRAAFDTSFARRDEVAPRLLPEPLFGPAILEANDPPVRVLWITAANPVAMLPESRTVARAIESRELTVVVDSFLTDSARLAHIVLPATTLLEDDDLLGAYGHHWLIESRPVVPAPAVVKSDYEIIQELARRTGLEHEFADDIDTWKRRVLRNVADKGASLDDLRRGPVRNPLVGNLLYVDRKFPTPTGKVNLVRTVDPQPTPVTAERPLLLMALSTADAQGSQWLASAQQGPATAVVHPEAAPQFQDGGLARLESEVGEMTVVLRFDATQRRDTVLMDKGGWLSAGRCANALVKAQLTDAGGCAVYYDTPVRLLPVE